MLLSPRYLSEITPHRVRGGVGSQSQVWINVGILIALVLGLPYEAHVTHVHIVHMRSPVAWWRIMLLAALPASVLQGLLLLACPESPVWLAEYGCRLRAARSYEQLWGLGQDTSEATAPLLPSTSANALAPTAASGSASTSSRESSALEVTTAPSISAAGHGNGPTSPARSRGSAGLGRPRSLAAQDTRPPADEAAAISVCISTAAALPPAAGPPAAPAAAFGLGKAFSAASLQDDGSVVAETEPWSGLLKRRYRRIMMLALALPILLQACGINTVVMYSSEVFRHAGKVFRTNPAPAIFAQNTTRVQQYQLLFFSS